MNGHNGLASYTSKTASPPVLVGGQTSFNYLSAITTPYPLLQLVVGLADAAAEYYDGSGWIQLQGTGWDNAVNSMVANWSVAGLPQLVVGLGNSSIQFYNSKLRYTTYMQMSEAMLAPLRQGRKIASRFPTIPTPRCA